MNQILKDIYDDKPIFYTLLVALVVIGYIIYKRSQVPIVSPDSSTPTVNPTQDGTFVESSYYNNTPTTINNTYTGNPAQIVTSTIPPPVATSVPKAPITTPTTSKTITVGKWPTQTSTLWGIAQKVYGNGNLWPKIYNANKSKIGNNPNLVYAGTVLTIP